MLAFLLPLACAPEDPSPRPGADGDADTDADVDTDADADADVDTDAGADTGTTPVVRPIGTVVVTDPSAPCPPQVVPGTTCEVISVSCPGIPDLAGLVSSTPAAAAALGTVVAFSGGGGVALLKPETIAAISGAGFAVEQVTWATDWEPSDPGMLVSACRPATAIAWVHDTLHADATRPFCGFGFSGGSGQLAYALAHYGAEELLDYVSLAEGPPFSRMDYGCAASTYAGPPADLCPELPDAPIELVSEQVDSWAGTTTCRDPVPYAPDLARWAATSILSPGADTDYPQTLLDLHDCAIEPTGAPAGAWFFSQEVLSAVGSVSCYTDCSGESLAGHWDEIADGFAADCVLRHHD